MTAADRPAAPLDRQGAALAGEVEGYLLVRAEREQARREAAALCARLPWLTTAQAEDLTAHYTEQRLGLTRQALRTVTERAAQLREEYEARYAALRRELLVRHTVCVVLMLLCAGMASAGSYLLAR
ncbi:hypothetical protein [Streptomyces sp. NPDC003032]